MKINREDILWNYTATFFKIASSALLFPFVLAIMPPEKVAIWTIFSSLTILATILDFGFSSSFTRNVSYVFSGVTTLMPTGHQLVSHQNGNDIDYGLLKGLLYSMKSFYFKMALILFFIYSTLGTYYMWVLMKDYLGDPIEVYISWGLLCVIVTYNLYTLYYDSLLMGRGMIKASKKITVFGNLLYLIFAGTLVFLGYGLIAIVFSQIVSVVFIRYFAYKTFFSKELVEKISYVKARGTRQVFKAVAPNAIKIGFTSLGGFMVNKSSIIIGSLFLTLEDLAQYGITMQLVGVISGLSGIYLNTYQPRIAYLRVLEKYQLIKQIYIKSQLIIIATFILLGSATLLLGDYALGLIDSQTVLIKKSLIVSVVIISFLEKNHSSAAAILLSKNKVPFFKASILSGIGTVALMLALFQYQSLGVATIIFAPGVIQGIYQNWKWPFEVRKELKISFSDYITTITPKQHNLI